MFMKRNTWVLSIIVLLALMAGAAIAGDRAGIKAFTAEEWFLAYLDPGTVTISDGMIHVRDQVIFVRYEASDPRVTGYYLGHLNLNLDSESSGNIWGTVESADENGIPIADGFIGTISGRVFKTSALVQNSAVKAVFHGKGANKGQSFEVNEAWDMDLTNPLTRYYAMMVGTIQDKAE